MAKEEILPKFHQRNDDPSRNYPTTGMLGDMGYGHLRFKLKKEHDMNLKTFFTVIVGVRDEESRWKIKDPITIKRAEEYLEWKQKYAQWSEATVKTNYYYLNRVFFEVSRILDTDSIIDVLDYDERRTQAYDAFVEAIFEILEEAKSDNSAYQYLCTAREFVDWLSRRAIIDTNPIQSLEKEFNLDLSAEGSEPMTPGQVADLWTEATTLTQYLTIIGYVFWGLRRQELPAVKRDQIHEGEDTMTIEFSSHQRKSGAGTVTVIIGENIISEQLARLGRHSTWNGHLLVDSDNPGEPMDAAKAAGVFRDLAEKADVRLENDDLPSPNNGRATWHDINSMAEALLMEMDYVEDQDYEDKESPLNYQGPETKQAVRRFLFKRRFFTELPDEATADGSVVAPNLEAQYKLTDLNEFLNE